MQILKIVIHCSDSNDDRDFTAEDIHRWHIERGWSGIGYHYVIRRDGIIEAGRPEYWQGAHVYKHNVNSLGICLIGRNVFTPEQFYTLYEKIKELKKKYVGAEVFNHYELDNKKTCPNFNVHAMEVQEVKKTNDYKKNERL